MKRYVLSFLAGLAVIIGTSLVLWFTLPFVFSAVTSGPDSWLGLFPFAIFIPSFLFGGYAAARRAPAHRVILGFVVGLVSTVFAGLFARSTGHELFLIFAVLIGGGLSAIGAVFAGKDAVSL